MRGSGRVCLFVYNDALPDRVRSAGTARAARAAGQRDAARCRRCRLARAAHPDRRRR